MKKIILSLLTIAFIFTYIYLDTIKGFAYTDFANETEYEAYLSSIGQLNNSSGKKANWNTYLNYDHQIIYGSPWGDTGIALNGIHAGKVEYRYLGFDINNNKVTNTYFPADAGGGGNPNTWFPYQNVGDALKTWDVLSGSQISHMLSSTLLYQDKLYQGITVNSIGGKTKAKVLSKPGWNASFSVFTQHYYNGSLRYATFYGPGMARNVSVSCSVSTTSDTYRMAADQESIDIPVTLSAVAQLEGQNVAAGQIQGIYLTFEGQSFSSTAGQQTFNKSYTKTIMRGSYTGPGTYKVVLSGYSKLKSIFANDIEYSGTGSKTITLIIEDNPNPYIDITATVDPEKKQVDGSSDETVIVNVKADLKNYSNLSNIKSWDLWAKLDGEDLTLQHNIKSGRSISANSSFTFTVSGNKFGIDDYIQKIKITATVNYNNKIFNNAYTTASKYVSSEFFKVTPPVPDPPPANPPPGNINPVAIISCSSVIMAGTDCSISGSGSYDPDGTIGSYIWNTNGATGSITGATGTVWWPETGNYTVGLTVIDDNGGSGSDFKTVNVIEPTPSAKITYSGSLKENRSITVDSSGSTSPSHYPIDEALTSWTITPVSGCASSDIKYNGSLTGFSSKKIQIKKAGRIQVNLTVTNTAGRSSTASTILDIAPDLPPVAKFDAIAAAFRNYNDCGQATLNFTCLSCSHDGDDISGRKWEYAYDSDNDSDYTDETWRIFDNENNTTPVLKVSEVGKYRIKETVTESFGQDTIPEFISPTDYKAASCEATVEVLNLPPVMDLAIVSKKKVDIVVDVGDTAQSNVNNIISKMNGILKPALQAKGIDVSFTVQSIAVSNDASPINKFYYENFTNNDRLTVYDPANGSYTTLTTDRCLYVVVGANGRVYFDNYTQGGKLYEYNPATGGFSARTSLGCVWNITPSPDGKIYYTLSAEYDRIFVYDPKNNSNTLCFSGAKASANGGKSVMTCTPDGKLYFPNGYTYNTLNVYDPKTGTVTNLLLSNDSGWGIAAGTNGRVYFRYGGYMYEYDPSSGINKKITSVSCLVNDVRNITAAPNGYIWFNNSSTSDLLYYNPGNSTVYYAGNNYWVLTTVATYGTVYYYDVRTGWMSNMAYPPEITRPQPVIYPLKALPSYVAKELNVVLPTYTSWRPGSNRFYVNLSDATLPELTDNAKLGTVLANLLTNKINFVGMGTSVNQSQFNTLISQNNNNGTYIANSNMDTAINSLTTYVAGFYDKKMDLVVNVGDTIEMDLNVIRSKIDSLVKPILSSNGKDANISVVSAKAQYGGNSVPSILSALTGASWRGNSERYIAMINNPVMDELNISNAVDQILSNMAQNDVSFIGMGTNSDKSQFEALVRQNGSKGVYIDNSNLDDALVKMANYIIDRAMADIYINIGSPAFDESVVRSKTDSILKPQLAQNNINARIILFRQNGHSLNSIIDPLSWRVGTAHYFVDLTDLIIPEFSDSSKTGDILNKFDCYEIDFTGMGANANQTQVNNFVPLNKGRGIFIDSTNLDSAFSSLSAHICDTINSRTGIDRKYLLLNEEIQYMTVYTDPENDPKNSERWKFTHVDPNYFENSLGILANSGMYVPAPVTQFDKVGKVGVTVGAQDIPKNDVRFENYKLWSSDSATKLMLYVHRKPFAQFVASFSGKDNSGNYIMYISDSSFDPDHVSRADKGIAVRAWQWKELTAFSWNIGMPAVLPPGKTFIIQLQVRDIEGAWSDPAEQIVITAGSNFVPEPVILAPQIQGIELRRHQHGYGGGTAVPELCRLAIPDTADYDNVNTAQLPVGYISAGRNLGIKIAVKGDITKVEFNFSHCNPTYESSIKTLDAYEKWFEYYCPLSRSPAEPSPFCTTSASIALEHMYRCYGLDPLIYNNDPPVSKISEETQIRNLDDIAEHYDYLRGLDNDYNPGAWPMDAGNCTYEISRNEMSGKQFGDSYTNLDIRTAKDDGTGQTKIVTFYYPVPFLARQTLKTWHWIYKNENDDWFSITDEEILKRITEPYKLTVRLYNGDSYSETEIFFDVLETWINIDGGYAKIIEEKQVNTDSPVKMDEWEQYIY